ncbi:MAG: acetyl-CoA carboxylase biotin carboxylase subunit [Acidimicrobiales bacterium]
MFDTVLVANRGEIAVRVIRACRDLGLRSVAVHSEADRGAFHTRLADAAVEIGPSPATQSYLNLDRLIAAAKESGAQAVHPGYGFLSESPRLAQACVDNGLTLIGPPADAMAAMGDKVTARGRMQAAGVPVVPGTDAISDPGAAIEAAHHIGYPILVKASAGGGGIGMRAARDEDELRYAIQVCSDAAARSFGDPRVFLERLVDEPRHIEIQVLADSHGNTIHLGERECSIQRRHQKLLEESPSTAVTDEMRQRMGEAAIKAARAVGYVNAGTVEFIESRGSFYFLEMNTRLQVEHPVTELVTGVDLVVAQLRIALGEPLPLTQEQVRQDGWAIECRVNAEDPWEDFLPTPGRVVAYHEPSGPGVRVDSSLAGPGVVSPFYDPMIAKLVVHGATREQAAARARRALYEYWIGGITTNIPYHAVLLEDPDFLAGRLTTEFIPTHPDLMGRARDWQRQQAQVMAQFGTDRRRLAAMAAALAAAGA